MPTHRFHVRISKKEWLRYYRGFVRVLMVRTTHGLRVSIPAHHFRTYTDNNGLHGFFIMVLDEKKQIVSLRRLSDEANSQNS